MKKEIKIFKIFKKKKKIKNEDEVPDDRYPLF